MRKLAILAALASTALATPAVARDHSVYVGLEGGVMWVEDTPFKITDNVTNPSFTLDHKTGWDVDGIAGYDFGPVRIEAELGYKRASIDAANTLDTVYAASGHANVLSLMGNVLFDFGDENGLSGYAGGGVGMARATYDLSAPVLRPYTGITNLHDSDSKLAFQGILGVRYAVSPNLDLGLKYRFFNVSRLSLTDTFAGATGPIPVTVPKARFRSHSLLASAIYNFWAPPPPPPPPPAPERGH
jgi:opacity protein-like surface antigen